MEDVGTEFVGGVFQAHPVVRGGDLDRHRVRRDSPQSIDESSRVGPEVRTDLGEGHDLPVVRQRGVERTQRIRDAATLFDGVTPGVSSVDDVPDEGADDT